MYSERERERERVRYMIMFFFLWFIYIGIFIFNTKLTHLVQKLKNLDLMGLLRL